MLFRILLATLLLLTYLTAGCTKSSPEPYGVITGKAKLAPGDTVGICWRPSMENFFVANNKPYLCQESINATVSPLDKTLGGVSCGSIDKALSRALGGKKRAEEMVKFLDPKQDPKAQKRGGKASILDATNRPSMTTMSSRIRRGSIGSLLTSSCLRSHRPRTMALRNNPCPN